MALKRDFYEEIFTNEQKWVELINANLLNSIYCKLTLKPFYEKKRDELEQECKVVSNTIMSQIIFVINRIINKINLLCEQYNNSEDIDIKSLLPLFLINQMGNTTQKGDNEINKLKEQKQFLESQIKNHSRDKDAIDDYLYDDFPEEQKKLK